MQIAKIQGILADVSYDFIKGMTVGVYLIPNGDNDYEPSFANVPIESGILKDLEKRIGDRKRKVIVTVEAVDDDNITNN